MLHDIELFRRLLGARTNDIAQTHRARTAPGQALIDYPAERFAFTVDVREYGQVQGGRLYTTSPFCRTTPSSTPFTKAYDLSVL